MSERIKLENPGDEKTLVVASVSTEQMGGYDYWIIADAQGQEIAVREKSIAGQLDRVGASSAADMVGKAIRFARSTKLNKFNKPFWDLDLVATTKANGATKPQSTPPKSIANKPNSDLPPLLQNAEAEDNAELAAKIGVDLSGIQKQLATYQAVAEWTVKTLPPIFNAGKDAVGMTPESLAACTNTIFINAAKK